MQSPSRLGIYALLLAMPLFFVSNLIIGRAVTNAVEPSTLAFWRWFLASLILLPFAWRGILDNAARLRGLWRELLALGVLGMLICGAGVYLSLRYTTASNSALIYTSSAILIVVLEAVFFRARLSGGRVLGALIGFAGVAVIILHGEVSRLLSWQFNVGDLGIALCAAAWAVYSILLKRKELKALPTLPLFAAITIVGSIVLAPFMLYELIALDALPRGHEQWIAIVALATLSVGRRLRALPVARKICRAVVDRHVALSATRLRRRAGCHHARRTALRLSCDRIGARARRDRACDRTVQTRSESLITPASPFRRAEPSKTYRTGSRCRRSRKPGDAGWRYCRCP